MRKPYICLTQINILLNGMQIIEIGFIEVTLLFIFFSHINIGLRIGRYARDAEQ
jgi:hypothetical protein